MTVVADSSPLIAFCRIGKINLLEELFGVIIIPDAVYNELTTGSFEVSADKVDSILITTAATITTDAIEFAVENNIDIVFLDFNKNPYGRVWHSKLGSTTLIRRRQLEAEASAYVIG